MRIHNLFLRYLIVVYRSFWWRFCVVTLFLDFSVGEGTSVIGLCQISSFFSSICAIIHLNFLSMIDTCVPAIIWHGSLLKIKITFCVTLTLTTISDLVVIWHLTLFNERERQIWIFRLIYKSSVPTKNTWQFNSAKTIFAFSCPPQLRRRAKLFLPCCRPYKVHQYTISLFPNLHLPGEIFTCKGVKS